MGILDRNSSKSYQLTEIDEDTLVQTDNRIATGGSFQSGDIGGSINTITTTTAPEAFALASQLLETNQRNTSTQAQVIDSVGSAAVDLVKDQSDFALDLSREGFDVVSDLASQTIRSGERQTDRALDFGSEAVDAITTTGREAVGFLTQLTDNVLSRDAIQKIAARTDAGLNEALRAVETVGTVGSQGLATTRTITTGLVIGGLAIGGAIYYMARRRKGG